MQDFIAAANDFFAFLTFDDDWWESFYVQWARDLNLYDSATFGAEANKKAVLNKVRCLKQLSCKGDTVKSARWFSVWDRYDEKLN